MLDNVSNNVSDSILEEAGRTLSSSKITRAGIADSAGMLPDTSLMTPETLAVRPPAKLLVFTTIFCSSSEIEHSAQWAQWAWQQRLDLEQ